MVKSRCPCCKTYNLKVVTVGELYDCDYCAGRIPSMKDWLEAKTKEIGMKLAREADVKILDGLCQGKTDEEIGKELFNHYQDGVMLK